MGIKKIARSESYNLYRSQERKPDFISGSFPQEKPELKFVVETEREIFTGKGKSVSVFSIHIVIPVSQETAFCQQAEMLVQLDCDARTEADFKSVDIV